MPKGIQAIQLALKNARELRVHMCQTSPQSEGARKFVKGCYIELKLSNPTLPILIRECQGTSARVYARFGKGVERSTSLDSQNKDQVIESIVQLLSN
ncbi:hypothetical protein LOD99_14299 [Oopsacas minuta]|uniref:NADH dehydrogenase [ubiquinone] 1 alpha subcomplex subunit 2 n=1 Tax=Oopsacas minuta TaxID=111878 RepID=A0AAV7KIF5_9METZ|nr:hypothetical protein LOD99_14299 [Oopsacas minuta]